MRRLYSCSGWFQTACPVHKNNLALLTKQPLGLIGHSYSLKRAWDSHAFGPNFLFVQRLFGLRSIRQRPGLLRRLSLILKMVLSRVDQVSDNFNPKTTNIRTSSWYLVHIKWFRICETCAGYGNSGTSRFFSRGETLCRK